MKELPYRKQIRLKDYDYSQDGAYFVTICVQDRECLFGDVADGQMILNDRGHIVEYWWQELQNKFPTIYGGPNVVMPDHFHGIINIIGTGFPRPQFTNHCQDLKLYQTTGGETPPLRKPTLGQIVGFFKYQTTKSINVLQKTPGDKIWQHRFHDHVIRDDDEYERICNYIILNPEKWNAGQVSTVREPPITTQTSTKPSKPTPIPPTQTSR